VAVTEMQSSRPSSARVNGAASSPIHRATRDSTCHRTRSLLARACFPSRCRSEQRNWLRQSRKGARGGTAGHSSGKEQMGVLTGRATMNPRASHSAFFAAGCHPACGFVRCAHMSAREEEWLEEFTAWAPGLEWLFIAT